MRSLQAFRSVVTTIVIVASMAGMAVAAPPTTMNYQGRLTDGGGTPINGTVDIAFSIYSVPAAGSQLWTESHANVPVADGLFEVILGDTNPLVDSVFRAAPLYLGIRVGADPEMTPRTELTGVPWAFRTATIDSATGGTVFGDLHLQSGSDVNAMEITQNGLGRGLRIGMDNVFSTEAALAIATQAFAPAIAIVPDGGGPAIQVTGAFGDGSIQFPTQSISGTEITDESVTSADLAPGSVGSDEIADFSIANVDIGGNEITADRRADEPGVAQSTLTTQFLLGNTVQSFKSVDINCPAAGYVLAIASASGLISHTNGQTDLYLFGVSESGTGLDNDQDKDWQLSSAQPTGSYRAILSAQKIFPVTAGSHTFHASAIDAGGTGGKFISEITISVVYFPTNYGTVQQ